MRNQTSYYSVTNQISHLNMLKKEVSQYYRISYTSVWDLALIDWEMSAFCRSLVIGQPRED